MAASKTRQRQAVNVTELNQNRSEFDQKFALALSHRPSLVLLF